MKFPNRETVESVRREYPMAYGEDACRKLP